MSVTPSAHVNSTRMMLLRDYLYEGDTLYVNTQHLTRTGRYRYVRVYVIPKGLRALVDITTHVATMLGRNASFYDGQKTLRLDGGEGRMIILGAELGDAIFSSAHALKVQVL